MVARCHEVSYIDKIRKVGADAIVSPDFTGGMRIASSMIRPQVVSFLDEMLRTDDRLRVEEIHVPAATSFAEGTRARCGLRKAERVLLAGAGGGGGWGAPGAGGGGVGGPGGGGGGGGGGSGATGRPAEGGLDVPLRSNPQHDAAVETGLARSMSPRPSPQGAQPERKRKFQPPEKMPRAGDDQGRREGGRT